MKDSGIEWIGASFQNENSVSERSERQIPEDWELKKLKYIATSFLKGNGITKEQIVENGDTPCVRYGDIYSKYSYVFEECKVRTNKNIIDSPKFFSYGDILFTCTGELIEEIGKSIVYLGKDKCLAGGDIFIAKHSQNPTFMGYALDSFYVQNQKSFGKAKLKVVHISTGEIQNLFICLPPLETQKRIADFLDDKCGKIDSLKSDIQKQIETLEQYKKSVITEAVTGKVRIDNGKAYKREFSKENSVSEQSERRIEWIGEIPEDWEVKHIGQIYVERRQKVNDRDYPPLSVTMKGIVPQLETAAKSDAHDDRKLVCKGDFAINSRSDRRGSCGISPCDGSISLINTVLIPLGKMNPDFYNWLFHTPIFADEFYKNGHGIVDDLWTTSWQEMKKIAIQIPPMKEQKQIADYLDTKCSKIDSIIASKKHQLETLEEYKKSLIFEYVTGKKEVE